MNNIIMESLIALAKAIIDKARKKGFDILLLLACLIFLGYWVMKLDARVTDNNKAWETRFLKEAEALNQARIDFLECDIKRQELAVRVTELTAIVRDIKNKDNNYAYGKKRGGF